MDTESQQTGAKVGKPALSPGSGLRGRTSVGPCLTAAPPFVTYQAPMVKIRGRCSVLLVGNSKGSILKQPEHSVVNKRNTSLKTTFLFLVKFMLLQFTFR